MKIIVFGTRGIPDILGGVETHCEQLYPRIASDSIKILLFRRSSYIKKRDAFSYRGVMLKDIYAPKSKSFEAIVHSILSLLYAIRIKPDLIHVHAIGPSLVIPIARFLGFKVVMTHHGPDYKRKKWNKVSKVILRIGEWAGVRFANRVIVISDEIRNHVITKYKRHDVKLIPNGVPKPLSACSSLLLNSYNLKRGNYILSIGRFVPEKGFSYLIEAFKQSNLNNKYKLVIAGATDHETNYSKGLMDLAFKSGVVLPGFLKGEDLAQIFKNASLFVLPSFYEGLPITLLEAMSYNLPIVASDITANKEVDLPSECYFKVGDTKDLSLAMQRVLTRGYKEVNYDLSKYNWDNIALSTIDIYTSLFREQ